MQKVLDSAVMGAPDDLRQVLLRQCAPLLTRLRQTVPFPYPPKATALFLTPPLQDDELHQNLRLSIMWGHLVHVAIETAEDWKASMAGTRDWQRVFWMALEDPAPVPDALTHPFRLYESHPGYERIRTWHQKATVLDKEIEAAISTVDVIGRHVSHPALLRHVWPELLNFVKLRGPTVMHVPKARIDHVKKVVLRQVHGEQSLQSCAQLLAAASLLEPHEASAWVSFKTV